MYSGPSWGLRQKYSITRQSYSSTFGYLDKCWQRGVLALIKPPHLLFASHILLRRPLPGRPKNRQGNNLLIEALRADFVCVTCLRARPTNFLRGCSQTGQFGRQFHRSVHFLRLGLPVRVSWKNTVPGSVLHKRDTHHQRAYCYRKDCVFNLRLRLEAGSMAFVY